MGEDQKVGDQKRKYSGPMYALRGPVRREPPVDKTENLMAAIGAPARAYSLSDPEPSRRHHRPSAERYGSSQSLYLAASGTLIQFNAVMAAIQVAALTASVGLLKFVVATALLLHVFAAFVLCWAARPIDDDQISLPLPLAAVALTTSDTFKYYRRGWRLTLTALLASSLVVILFMAEAFDFHSIVDTLNRFVGSSPVKNASQSVPFPATVRLPPEWNTSPAR